MPKFDDKPTETFIGQAFSYLNGVWGPCHGGWEKRDSFYHRRYDVWPNNTTRPSHRPSRPTAIVDRATDTLISFTPTVRRAARGDTAIADQEADETEVALQTIFADSDLHEMVLPMQQAWLHLIQYEYSIMEVEFDWLSRPIKPVPKETGFKNETDEEFAAREVTFEVAKANWNPIRLKAPSPFTVLMDPEKKQPDYALKVENILAYQLEDLSKRLRDPGPGLQRRNMAVFDTATRGLEPFQSVRLLHYWTEKWHSVLLSSESTTAGEKMELLWTQRNPWGFMPFHHAFARAGIMPRNTVLDRKATGLNRGTGDLNQSASLGGFNPAFIARGILEPVEDMLRLQAQGVSARHKLSMDTAFALMATEDATEEEIGEALQNENIIRAAKDSIWLVKTPEMSAAMFSAAAEADADIERGTFTDVLQGGRNPGVTTASQHAMQSQAATRQFQTPIIQLQHMASIAGERMLRMVKVLDKTSTYDKIGINGRLLKASKIGDDTAVLVTFADINPALQIQAKESDRRDFELGLMSEEDFIRKHHSEDVTGWQRRIRETRLERTPALIQIQSEDIAQDMGIEDDLRRAREREAGETGRSQDANLPINPAEGQPIAQSTTNPLRQSLDGNTQNPARGPG